MKRATLAKRASGVVLHMAEPAGMGGKVLQPSLYSGLSIGPRESLAGLTLFEVDAEHHKEACRMLNRMRGARLAYVDASSLAFMGLHQIDTVWSTDHHLGLTGARVLPRS